MPPYRHYRGYRIYTYQKPYEVWFGSDRIAEFSTIENAKNAIDQWLYAP